MSICLRIENVIDYSPELSGLQSMGLRQDFIYSLIQMYFQAAMADNSAHNANFKYIMTDDNTVMQWITESCTNDQTFLYPQILTGQSLQFVAKNLLAIHVFYGRVIDHLHSEAKYMHEILFGYTMCTPVVTFTPRISGWYINIISL